MINLNIKPNNVILTPHVSERAVLAADKGVYVFRVDKRATKKSIEASFYEIYGIRPIKIRLLNVPPKRVFVRGKWGLKGGYKKAYVYLKKGDKIEVI